MSCQDSTPKYRPSAHPQHSVGGLETVVSPLQKRFQLGNIVPGVFTPVLSKHSKSFSLIDCISVGVDRMQRNFEPMRKQVETWQRSELTDVTAKVEVRGIPAENDLESLQCVHVSIQGTGSHSTVQGDGQAGRIPRSPVLSIVLARAGCVGRPALDTEDQRAAPTSFPQARWNEAFAADAFACSV